MIAATCKPRFLDRGYDTVLGKPPVVAFAVACASAIEDACSEACFNSERILKIDNKIQEDTSGPIPIHTEGPIALWHGKMCAYGIEGSAQWL